MGNLVLHDPVGEKWDRKKKSEKHPTFAVLSPVQPPLRLVFDILMVSYQNEEEEKTDQLSLKDKGTAGRDDQLWTRAERRSQPH